MAGPILHPQPALVAGVRLELEDVNFTLCRCPHCEFQFKDPIIDAAKLIACYAAADSDNWELAPDPLLRNFDVLRTVLECHAPGRRVLDVGCFNGAMLSFLGDSWSRYGVEPSHAAADLARQRGVNILGDTLESVNSAVEPFDAIMAIDVVEHLVDPVHFFCQISARLKSGGIFLLLTGNTEALAWRLQGSMYWYSSLPEHVSFYNRPSLEKLGGLSGMECIECRAICHKRLPLKRWIIDSVKSAGYIAGRTVGGLGVPLLRRIFVERRGPTIQSAKDHLICVLRKR